MQILDDGDGGLVLAWTPRRWPRPTWHHFNIAAFYLLGGLAGTIALEAVR